MRCKYSCRSALYKKLHSLTQISFPTFREKTCWQKLWRNVFYATVSLRNQSTCSALRLQPALSQWLQSFHEPFQMNRFLASSEQSSSGQAHFELLSEYTVHPALQDFVSRIRLIRYQLDHTQSRPLNPFPPQRNTRYIFTYMIKSFAITWPRNLQHRSLPALSLAHKLL